MSAVTSLSVSASSTSAQGSQNMITSQPIQLEVKQSKENATSSSPSSSMVTSPASMSSLASLTSSIPVSSTVSLNAKANPTPASTHANPLTNPTGHPTFSPGRVGRGPRRGMPNMTSPHARMIPTTTMTTTAIAPATLPTSSLASLTTASTSVLSSASTSIVSNTSASTVNTHKYKGPAPTIYHGQPPSQSIQQQIPQQSQQNPCSTQAPMHSNVISRKTAGQDMNVYRLLTETDALVATVENWAYQLHQNHKAADTASFLQAVRSCRTRMMHNPDVPNRLVYMDQPTAPKAN